MGNVFIKRTTVVIYNNNVTNEDLQALNQKTINALKKEGDDILIQ